MIRKFPHNLNIHDISQYAYMHCKLNLPLIIHYMDNVHSEWLIWAYHIYSFVFVLVLMKIQHHLLLSAQFQAT